MTVFFYHNRESNEDNDEFLLAIRGFLLEDIVLLYRYNLYQIDFAL